MKPYIFVMILFFVMPHVLSAAEPLSFYALKIKGNHSGEVHEIVIVEKAKSQWEAKRILNGKESTSRKLKEVEFLSATLRIRSLLKTQDQKRRPSSCREEYIVLGKENKRQEKKQGCLENNKNFVVLYAELLALLYKR
ncbi:MAG: hypothetical protein HYY62_03955 [Deltaproteobacteria bacterium]|nr:hypothetical protein [Deltaproteobacteria bacterium]